MSLCFKKISLPYTELSPHDKGKILAYMKNFNITQTEISTVDHGQSSVSHN